MSGKVCKDVRQKSSVSRAAVQKVLVPPDRHITTPFQTLAEEAGADAGPEYSMLYEEVAKLIDNTSLADFQLVRRRLKQNFKIFAMAAAAKKLPLGKGKTLSKEVVREQEMDFLDDFFSLLQAAHFKVLTCEEYDTACDNDFTFTNPLEVSWDGMDKQVLCRFSQSRPEEFAHAASICENVLVMHRGIREVKARGMFLNDKIDLLVLYILAEPFERLFSKLSWIEWKELWPRWNVSDSTIASGGYSHGPKSAVNKATVEQRPHTSDPLLDHANARWVERVTLKSLMPDTKSVFKLLLKTVEIQEPAFKDVLILYRRKIDPHAKPSSEKEIIKEASPEEIGRNIHIKRFADVPMADMEMIFPDKKVYLKPLLLFQLFITVMIGLVSVIITLITTEGSWSLLGAVLSIIGTRAYQVWSSAQLGRQNVLDMITETLYEKTMDAQEGVLFFLLDQMAEQHVKELMLAYFTLLRHGKPLSQQQLDKLCEDYLKDQFSESVDFALENSLPVLLKDGLITQDAQGLLHPVPIEEGRKILAAKGERVFQPEAEQQRYKLPLFERLVSRKPRVSFKGSRQSPGEARLSAQTEQVSPPSTVTQRLPEPSRPPPDQPNVSIQPAGKPGASPARGDDHASKAKKGISAVKGLFKHSNKGE